MGNYLNDLKRDSLSSQSSNLKVLGFIDKTLKTVPGFKYRRHNRPVILLDGNWKPLSMLPAFTKCHKTFVNVKLC